LNAFTVRRLDKLSSREFGGLCDVLIDCVEGGASVSFMRPMTVAKAAEFWREVAASMARGERALLIAEDAQGAIVGTAQVIWASPENQPHRADVAKMLVHRRARRLGVGAAVLEAAERAAAEAGKSLLVLDTASADAERLYNAAAGSAWAPFPNSRCGPTAHPATRWSTTKGYIDAARVTATSSRTATAGRTMKRREFISALGGASAFAFLPAFTRAAFTDAATLDELTISDVEILKLSGTHELVPGLNRQYQVNPLHLYAERQPKPFKDPPENAKPERRPLTHYYVRIRTKGGVEGLYGAVDKEALPVLLGTLRPLVIGQNALAVERIWDQMYRSNRHSRASHFMMAISYIDNALWDLRGRHFGAPVFRLLGGPTQLPVRVYGSCLGFSIDPPLAAKRAAALAKDGFIHQKWFLGYGPGDGAHGMDLNVQLVKALRDAVGDDVQIMFDAYQGWDLQYAIEWCRKVEQYRPYFVEEAVPMSDLESFIRLSKATSIPIATGEHLYGRWEAEQFFKADALQFIQADPEWCGGVSETVKIAHLASVHGVKLLPHCHNVHAALHIVASQSPSVCPFGEYLINHVPEKLHFMKDPLLTTNGLVQLSEKPGFGIELDPVKVEKQEILVTI